MEIRSSQIPPTLNGNTLEGYIAVYNDVADVKDFDGKVAKETIRKGAFKEALNGDDIVMYSSHDTKRLPLGRTKSKTLTLREDEKGLWFSLKLDKKIAEHKTIKALVERGDLFGASMGWWEADEKVVRTNRGGKLTREVSQINRLDHVCVINTPAYAMTDLRIREVLDQTPDLEAMKLRMEKAEKETQTLNSLLGIK
jgi:HK97 family phage prohead protease